MAAWYALAHVLRRHNTNVARSRRTLDGRSIVSDPLVLREERGLEFH